ncbi:hypothetical protein [Streptomyces sp. NPDC052012]|uniref:arsenate reductase/protein-tyrosine-phosphatase family protein n=1 Tax=Streptomyces sp. NPDC052012 TaxID=3155051 RepID=UPI00344D420A
MDRRNLESLHSLASERVRAKLRLYLGDRDVPDPWGGDEAAFAAVMQLVEKGAAQSGV